MNEQTTTTPTILQGSPASDGVAIGNIWTVSHRDLAISTDRISKEEIQGQLKRANQVLQKVEQQLFQLKDTQSDPEILEILDAQVQIIRDPELYKRVENLIQQEQRNSEDALFSAFNEFIHLLRQTGQKWINDRIIDLQSLRDMIIRETSDTDLLKDLVRGSVVFADELSPTEIIEYSEAGISGIVMQHGGTTSHAVIIAQSLDIPCIVGVKWRRTQLENHTTAAIDAGRGEVIIHPTEALLEEYRKKQVAVEAEREHWMEVVQRPSLTACGTSFRLQANIEFEEELKHLQKFGAKGIGLLRTETLFLRQGYFDIERHIRFYRTVLKETGKDPVTIRLLDVGGDKFPGKKLEEANPFLGWRGIRMLLDEKTLLKKQLKAILMVAAEYPGRVQILVPMVSDVCEIDQVREQLTMAGRELSLDSSSVPLGIMVEVPAIALQAEEAARRADFFSIGSNDLTQYILAADRGNEYVSRSYNAMHPAVWKLIRHSVEAAKVEGIPVSICGEIAGKPLLAAALLSMGIHDLSMNPSSIPSVKQLLCNYEIKQFSLLLDSILQASDGKQAAMAIDDLAKEIFELT